MLLAEPRCVLQWPGCSLVMGTKAYAEGTPQVCKHAGQSGQPEDTNHHLGKKNCYSACQETFLQEVVYICMVLSNMS